MCVCVCMRARQTTKCKAMKRMRRLQTQVVLQVLLRIRVYVIGRMSIYRLEVPIKTQIKYKGKSSGFSVSEHYFQL